MRTSASLRLCSFAAALAVCLLACSPSNEPAASKAGDGDLDRASMKLAVSEALAIPDTLDRVDAITDLMRKLDASNVEGAMEAYDAAVQGLDRDEVRLFANAWARLDPRAALERFTTWRAPRVGQSAISEVVHTWTRRGGAEEAREFALASLGIDRPEGQTVRNLVVDATAAGLAAAGQYDELTKLLESFPSDDGRNWIITQGMLELYRNGTPALRAWVDSIPWEAENALKHDALRSALISMAGFDGPQAAAWYETVEAKLPPGSFLEAISEAWGAREPLANLEWLTQRPESEARRLALRAGAYHYLKQDGKAASDWISARLGDPAIKAAMLFPLTQYTISVDLEQALPLAEQIEAPGERVSSLKQILVMWSRRDFPAVERYMADEGVPPEVERAVRSMHAIRQKQQQEKATRDEGQKS
jgi:hypothetical protein